MKKLRKADWEVRPVTIETGKRLVSQYHYAKSASNTFTYLHGLFERGEIFEANCVGVAWWIPPTKGAAKATFPTDWRGVLCLSRLVIVPGAPKNSCSFLLGRSQRMINRERWPCLVTYADEWQGHTGAIYRATNWTYAGPTKPERVFVRDGVMVSRKRGNKTLTHQQMFLEGCELLGRFAKHKFVMGAPDVIE